MGSPVREAGGGGTDPASTWRSVGFAYPGRSTWGVVEALEAARVTGTHGLGGSSCCGEEGGCLTGGQEVKGVKEHR